MSAANASYSPSELHKTMRSASSPEYSSASTTSKPPHPKNVRQKLARAELILQSPLFSNRTLGTRPVSFNCAPALRRKSSKGSASRDCRNGSEENGGGSSTRVKSSLSFG